MTKARADGWDGYVDRFHAQEPGITEALLSRTDDDGTDPYSWCVAPLAGWPGPVLDLACGSGPVADALGRDRDWVGIDTSRAELAVGAASGRTGLVRASATGLPVPDGAAPAVTCAMGLQVVEPLDRAVAELARVLAPGGRAVLLLPASRPLGRRDAWTYLRLQVALRQAIRYPNDRELAHPRIHELVTAQDLSVTSDERRPFLLPVDRATAELLVRSLYLPGASASRRARGAPVVAARAGDHLAVPLRRVVLDRR